MATDVEATCDGCGHPAHEPNSECWYMDLSACPYFRGEGSCTFGCTTEPSCMTDRPRGGWPGEHRANHTGIVLDAGIPRASTESAGGGGDGA